MVCPGKDELSILRHGEIIERLPVSQGLAGMIGRRLQVDEGLGDEIGHGIEGRLGQIVVQVLAGGEYADPQGIAVGGESRDSLANMFRRGSVHHRAHAGFEPPAALARGDHDRASSEARHRRLERGERAQRRIEKEEAEDLSRKRLRLRMRLQRARKVEQREHFIAAKIGKIDKALHGKPVPRQALLRPRSPPAHCAGGRRVPLPKCRVARGARSAGRCWCR
jgi:hypothetical protein